MSDSDVLTRPRHTQLDLREEHGGRVHHHFDDHEQRRPDGTFLTLCGSFHHPDIRTAVLPCCHLCNELLESPCPHSIFDSSDFKIINRAES